MVYTVVNTWYLIRLKQFQVPKIYFSNISVQLWILLDCAVRCSWWWMRQYQWVSNSVEEKAAMMLNRLGSITNYVSQSTYAQQWFTIISATHSIKRMKYVKWTFWGLDLLICNVMVFAIIVGIISTKYVRFYAVIGDIGTYGMGATCLLVSIVYSMCGSVVVK